MQALVLAEAAQKEDRLAAGLRLAGTASRKLGDQARAVAAYEKVLGIAPGQPEALRFLAEAYSAGEQWDELVGLYEDQLRGGVRQGRRRGAGDPRADRHGAVAHARPAPGGRAVLRSRAPRRADPRGDAQLLPRVAAGRRATRPRLATILSDAQRALPDGAEKRAVATEIAQARRVERERRRRPSSSTRPCCAPIRRTATRARR